MYSKKVRLWRNIAGGVAAISVLVSLIILVIGFIPIIQGIMEGRPMDMEAYGQTLVLRLIAPSIVFYLSLAACIVLAIKHKKLKTIEEYMPQPA